MTSTFSLTSSASERDAGPTDHRASAVACARVLRAVANQLATAGRSLPDPSGEGWHRVHKVLEAVRAHEQNLGIGGDDGEAGVASGDFGKANFYAHDARR